MVIWGISSALIIEVVGSMGGWIYTTRWWNPALFQVNAGSITLLPLMIWGISPIIFYGIALWLRLSMSEKADL